MANIDSTDSFSDPSDFDLFETDLFPGPHLDSSSSSSAINLLQDEKSDALSDFSSDDSWSPRQVVNPIAHVLLAGALLPGLSPLHLLESHVYILERIFSYHLCAIWRDTLTPSPVPHIDSSAFQNQIARNEIYNDHDLNLAVCKVLTFDAFPPPSGLWCNMMPFIPSDPATLPAAFASYAPLIARCVDVMGYPHKVCYLTIDESSVIQNGPQRRAGIHTDGFLANKYPDEQSWFFWGGLQDIVAEGEEVESHRKDLLHGIILASSVANSCQIWPLKIPRRSSAVLTSGCDLDHVRGTLNEIATPISPGRNELFWMTDATPHESLPLQSGTVRQFFRIVTNDISAWWRQHSTPNPLGIEPECKIIEHSKFERDAYNFVSRESCM